MTFVKTPPAWNYCGGLFPADAARRISAGNVKCFV